MSNFLAMSDEDFINSSHHGEDFEPEEKDIPSGSEPSDISDEDISEGSSELSDDHFEEHSDDLSGSEDDGDSELDETGEGEEEGSSEPEPFSVDELKELMAPFKANGTEVQARSVAEAKQLMQQGANYTKKMQSLSPYLKQMKTLEQAGLLEPEKINYLIDLSKKEPKAIAKLVSEAGIDTYDLQADPEYKPNDHQVSETAIQLEQVLETIESTPTYSRTMDIVGNQWDSRSRELLASEPTLIAQINEQMSMGIFDKIKAEVEHVKMFGGLQGMSDFEAYRKVGSEMYAKGLLVPNQQAEQKPVARTQVKQQDASRNKIRKAAATPRQTTRQAPRQEYNPLAMSDEEFIKLNNINV